MYLLGVDIGGTKTAAIVSNESGEIIAFERGAGSNYQGCGVEESHSRIKDTLDRLYKKAGISRKEINNAFFGVAGADLEYDYQIIKQILDRLELRQYHFDNDGLIALRSGTVSGLGIMVACGTGSISFGNDGKTILRKGGFSQFFGERLGGNYIAHLAASAIMRNRDNRGPKTIMDDILREKHGVDIEEMMKIQYPGLSYDGPDPDVTLIKTLFEAAGKNDYLATNLLANVTEEVIRIVNAFRRDMAFTPVIPLVLEGTVFKKSGKLLQKFIKTALGDEYRITLPDHDPVTGAVMFAMDKAGIEIDKQKMERLVRTYNQKKEENT